MSEQKTAEAPSKDRRGLRAAVRWGAALLAFAVAGTGTAYGLTRLDRTDVPGLSTLGDGRWDYPVLAKPTLPAGAPLPAAPDNEDGRHYAPLRSLLLPAPAGSRPDTTVKADKDGAVSVDAFLEEYTPRDRDTLRPVLEYEGLIQIVVRAWTMPDGTRSRVYLLRFASSAAVGTFTGCSVNSSLKDAETLVPDLEWGKGERDEETVAPRNVNISAYEEGRPYAGEQTRLGCLQAGDVQSVIVQSRKGASPLMPLHQALVLQSQLLG
ncbi:hypothetical protein GCM10010347_58420 [Streptomyces cirratus]|uniref:Secreted protein n=1 Tax=Streptomyces cirratus TaxID=68187 RepID=A0ABQ3F3X8_9ACTN|nr:hypothetical protein [Streptomyces cirratus]GHB80101.1 hypothetical protein GCM10010347_58420 [Streptomyces cirratus]